MRFDLAIWIWVWVCLSDTGLYFLDIFLESFVFHLYLFVGRLEALVDCFFFESHFREIISDNFVEDKFTIFCKVQNPLGIFVVKEAVFKDGLNEVETFLTRVENAFFKHFLNGWNVHGVLDEDIVIDQSSFFILERLSELITVGVTVEERKNETDAFKSFWGDRCLWGEDWGKLKFWFEHQNLENFY